MFRFQHDVKTWLAGMVLLPTDSAASHITDAVQTMQCNWMTQELNGTDKAGLYIRGSASIAAKSGEPWDWAQTNMSK